jgi:hypothetical protein
MRERESSVTNQWDEWTPEQCDGIGVIKNLVCAHCRNILKQRCIEECAPEGLYRNLEPRELDEWRHPLKIPCMSRLMEFAPVTRFALMYLILYYMQSRED